MKSLPIAMMVVIGVFVAVITIGRWWLVNDTITDRLLNRALSWNLPGLLLLGFVGRLGSFDLAMNLFTIFGCMTVANVFGVATLLDGADVNTAARRQRRYDTIAAAAGFILLASVVADSAGMSLDWGPAIWSLTTVPTALCGLHFTRACIRELRATNPTAKERLTYSALLVAGGYIFVATPVGAVWTAMGTRPDDFGLGWTIGAAATLVILTALIAIPLVHALLARAELDRAGRCCRRLRPLWRVLTAAVPEVVLDPGYPGSGESTSRLYRMTVEIRDALVQLEQFAPEASESHADMREFASRIAQAAQAKTDGRSPVAAVTRRGATTPVVRDRADELRYLSDLARAWPRASV